jgi:hypothetical protein
MLPPGFSSEQPDIAQPPHIQKHSGARAPSTPPHLQGAEVLVVVQQEAAAGVPLPAPPVVGVVEVGPHLAPVATQAEVFCHSVLERGHSHLCMRRQWPA